MQYFPSLSRRTLPAAGISPLVLFAALCAAPANAQWTVVVLDPPGTTYSECNRIQDGQQVGYVDFGNGAEAALWSGSAGSFVDLHPGGSTGTTPSQARGVQGGRQVGHSYPHAGYWTGNAGSWVDLAPAGSSTSIAYDVAGNQVAGEARFGSTTKATLWNLTGGGSTDLHPIGGPPCTFSSLNATDGTQQAGAASFGSASTHAVVWTGSNTSWVDLHPAAATTSYALDVDLGQQVGRALFGSSDHAALWAGSATSFVDLHPAGAARSTAYGVHQGEQVGEAYFGFYAHASLWSGSAASRVDLHAFLPAGWTASQAFGIWHDVLGTTYVVGAGHLGTRNYAVMWVKSAPVWSDLGFAKAGGTGVPHLTGSGALTVGSLNTLSLAGAAPQSTAVLVLGVLPAYVPFLGGVLVPDLMLLLPLTTDALGAVDFQVTVPGGLPIGLPLRFQHWIEDPAVSFGYSASNGVLGILQ